MSPFPWDSVLRDDKDLMAAIPHLDLHQNLIKCSLAQRQSGPCEAAVIERKEEKQVNEIRKLFEHKRPV